MSGPEKKLAAPPPLPYEDEIALFSVSYMDALRLALKLKLSKGEREKTETDARNLQLLRDSIRNAIYLAAKLVDVFGLTNIHVRINDRILIVILGNVRNQLIQKLREIEG